MKENGLGDETTIKDIKLEVDWLKEWVEWVKTCWVTYKKSKVR